MTGQELIDFIKDNHLEDYEVRCYDHFGDEGYLWHTEIDDDKKEVWLIG